MPIATGSYTDWVTIARAGATIDGRELAADTLKRMAKSYNVNDYTAVINYNHVYGNLGTVRELRTVESGGKVELQARIRPNKYYYLYNGEAMGLFFSIEYVKNFAKTGEPYLVGLAATDNPASLGTSEMHFSALGDNSALETGEAVKAEKLSVSRRSAADLIREAVNDALAKFFNRNNQEKEDYTMTKEELTGAVNEALQPFKAQLESLQSELKKFTENDSGTDAGAGDSDKNSPDTDAGDSGENSSGGKAGDGGELSGDYRKLQESYAALKTSVEGLAAKLDAALAKQPGKAEKVSSGAAENDNGFIL